MSFASPEFERPDEDEDAADLETLFYETFSEPLRAASQQLDYLAVAAQNLYAAQDEAITTHLQKANYYRGLGYPVMPKSVVSFDDLTQVIGAVKNNQDIATINCQLIREQAAWLADPETTETIADLVQAKLVEKKINIIGQRRNVHIEDIKRTLPARVAEVRLGNGTEKFSPQIKRWQRDKKIGSPEVADELYLRYMSQAREQAMTALIDDTDALVDDNIDEVEAEELQAAVGEAVITTYSIDDVTMSEYEERSDQARRGLSNEEPDLIDSWLEILDFNQNQWYFKEIMKNLANNKKIALGFYDDLKSPQRHVIEEIVSLVVDQIVESHADKWRGYVDSIAEDVKAAALLHLQGELAAHLASDPQNNQPTAEVKTKKRNNGLRVPLELVQSVSYQEQAAEEIQLTFDWMDQPVPVETVVVEGQTIGYALAISDKLQRYYDSVLEGPDEASRLADVDQMARHNAVNGTWSTARQSVAMRGSSLYSYDIKKYAKKHHGKSLRAYYSLVPTEDESLRQVGVESVLVLLAVCSKDDQDYVLSKLTGLSRRAVHNYGAGQAGR